MRTSLTAILLFSTCLHLNAADITTEESFIKAIKTVFAEKSVEKLNAITYRTGMSEADKARVAKAQASAFENREVENVSLVALPKGFFDTYIVQGMKHETTAKPSGMAKIDFKKNGSAITSMSMPYAVVSGAYFLVSTKSTDLKWTGPSDVNIGFMVMGKGQDKVMIHGKYNASGVEVDRDFSGPSSTTWGQHFSEIVVTSDDPETDVTLTVFENAKEVFKSEPLKGKGKVTYKKKS